MDIKIMAVTIHKSAMVILGLSPPKLNHLTNQGGCYTGVRQHLDEGFAFHGRCGRKCVSHHCQGSGNEGNESSNAFRIYYSTLFSLRPFSRALNVLSWSTSFLYWSWDR